MTLLDTQTIRDPVRLAFERDDLNQAIRILGALKSVERAEDFKDLDDDNQVSLLPNLAIEISADSLENSEAEKSARLAANLRADMSGF